MSPHLPARGQKVITQAIVSCSHMPFSHCTVHMTPVTVCFKIHKCPWGNLQELSGQHQAWWASSFSWWKAAASSKSQFASAELPKTPSAFPLTNFSPSPPLLPSPVLSPCPTPRCPATCQQHSSATPRCTHKLLSQLLGESHYLGVHETDKWEISCQNQCINPLTVIIAFIIFLDRFTWPFKGQKYSSFKLIALSSLCQLH